MNRANIKAVVARSQEEARNGESETAPESYSKKKPDKPRLFLKS